MKRVFTKTFFRFLVAFLVMIAISCSLLIVTAAAKGKGTTAAAITAFMESLRSQ